MKAVMIQNQIINCEEIRNVYVAPGNSVRIFFKNCTKNDYDGSTDIHYKNAEENRQILEILFNEMTS